MTQQYHSLPGFITVSKTESVAWEETRNILLACKENSSFEIIEMQAKQDEFGTVTAEAIIVDCCCGNVGSRNKVGIKNRERLAIVYVPSDEFPYHVFALRKDFPITGHQMFIAHDYPRIICVYLEPWSACARTWTPRLFLKRIVIWLANAANASLHGDDLPPEHLFFSPTHTLFLPQNFIDNTFNELSFDLKPLYGDFEEKKRYAVRFISKEEATQRGFPKLDIIAVNLPTAIHGSGVESIPSTLGILDDALKLRGSSLFEALAIAVDITIKNRCGQNFFRNDDHDNAHTIIVCNLPVSRAKNAVAEKTETVAFVLPGGIKSLAIKLRVAERIPENGNYALNSSLIGIGNNAKEFSVAERRNLSIEPVAVKLPYDDQKARVASGLDDNYNAFDAVLGGVGALGSSLADIWVREGWGNWYYIDNDIVEPHNLARHTAFMECIGRNKADIIDTLSSRVYAIQNERKPITAKLNDFTNELVKDALATSSLIVDATTSLDAPRDLSRRDSIGRCVSVFISPSGLDSVLLFEDRNRDIRLDCLEYQYYRFILREEWGEKHLEKNNGNLWVGAGCREITTIMPYDIIKMHSGLIARQVRILSNQDGSVIKIFRYNDEKGELLSYSTQGIPVIKTEFGNWKIIYDNQLIDTIAELRHNNLPMETGGVLVGYIDQKAKRIYLVDALAAPPDSVQDATGFERGSIGLKQQLEDISKKTASIVSYIGEWHSHPKSCSCLPSILDVNLLTALKEQMNQDGQPVVMLIIGDRGVSICFGEENSDE